MPLVIITFALMLFVHKTILFITIFLNDKIAFLKTLILITLELIGNSYVINYSICENDICSDNIFILLHE